MNVFNRYAPFIQDYIYRSGWQTLRGVQNAAGEAIFGTDDNVLLSASTASGKTEAAFFPILTLLDEQPSSTVGVLYIAPLKALINDQFDRLNELCEETGIPVYRWHGDVSASRKRKLLKHPQGILQITPESLESLMINKHMEIPSLFGDLRFVVIDEIHSLLRGDRGLQTFCLIERLSRLAGCHPRRIGLSATIGDPGAAGRFLSAGSGRKTIIPKVEGGKEVWRLSMEHFYTTPPQADEKEPADKKDTEDERDTAAVEKNKENTQTDAQAQVYADKLLSEIKNADKLSKGLKGGSRGNRGTVPEDEDLPWSKEEQGNLAPDSVREPGTERISENGLESGTRRIQENGLEPGAERMPEDTLESGTENMPAAAPGSGMERTPMPGSEPATDTAPAAADPGLAYIFEHTRGKKCLIFTNSREECESVCQNLRQYCEVRHEPDRFLIHHGNLSASYRESAEEEMKDENSLYSVCATATLELGIDIGRLERAFQIDAPFTVSGFLQRMGRTGRRGDPPEMHFVMREDHPEARAMLPEQIPWYLIQGISLVQLYLEERFVEPPEVKRLPYSLLYHQTMSTLASGGEMTPAELASRILTLSCFQKISQDDYRMLLRHLLETDHINRTENGGLIVGITGERVVNNYKFFAVFQENIEYTVHSGSEELGTIVKPPPAGEKIAIAGRVWVVDEVDHKKRSVYCTLVKGKVPAYFGDVAGDIHTRILERMYQVLAEEKSYPYLMPHAVARLKDARHVFQKAEMSDEPLIHLGGNMWALFPWLGSYAFLALERFLKIRCGKRLGLRGLTAARPYYLQFTMKVSREDFYQIVAEEAEKDFDPLELVYPKEVPVFEKYDEYVPPELIRKGFANGVLDIDGMKRRVLDWGRRSSFQLEGF